MSSGKSKLLKVRDQFITHKSSKHNSDLERNSLQSLYLYLYQFCFNEDKPIPSVLHKPGYD